MDKLLLSSLVLSLSTCDEFDDEIIEYADTFIEALDSELDLAFQS